MCGNQGAEGARQLVVSNDVCKCAIYRQRDHHRRKEMFPDGDVCRWIHRDQLRNTEVTAQRHMVTRHNDFFAETTTNLEICEPLSGSSTNGRFCGSLVERLF